MGAPDSLHHARAHAIRPLFSLVHLGTQTPYRGLEAFTHPEDDEADTSSDSSPAMRNRSSTSSASTSRATIDFVRGNGEHFLVSFDRGSRFAVFDAVPVKHRLSTTDAESLRSFIFDRDHDQHFSSMLAMRTAISRVVDCAFVGGVSSAESADDFSTSRGALSFDLKNGPPGSGAKPSYFQASQSSRSNGESSGGMSDGALRMLLMHENGLVLVWKWNRQTYQWGFLGRTTLPKNTFRFDPDNPHAHQSEEDALSPPEVSPGGLPLHAKCRITRFAAMASMPHDSNSNSLQGPPVSRPVASGINSGGFSSGGLVAGGGENCDDAERNSGGGGDRCSPPMLVVSVDAIDSGRLVVSVSQVQRSDDDSLEHEKLKVPKTSILYDSQYESDTDDSNVVPTLFTGEHGVFIVLQEASSDNTLFSGLRDSSGTGDSSAPRQSDDSDFVTTEATSSPSVIGGNSRCSRASRVYYWSRDFQSVAKVCGWPPPKDGGDATPGRFLFSLHATTGRLLAFDASPDGGGGRLFAFEEKQACGRVEVSLVCTLTSSDGDDEDGIRDILRRAQSFVACQLVGCLLTSKKAHFFDIVSGKSYATISLSAMTQRRLPLRPSGVFQLGLDGVGLWTSDVGIYALQPPPVSKLLSVLEESSLVPTLEAAQHAAAIARPFGASMWQHKAKYLLDYFVLLTSKPAHQEHESSGKAPLDVGKLRKLLKELSTHLRNPSILAVLFQDHREFDTFVIHEINSFFLRETLDKSSSPANRGDGDEAARTTDKQLSRLLQEYADVLQTLHDGSALASSGGAAAASSANLTDLISAGGGATDSTANAITRSPRRSARGASSHHRESTSSSRDHVERRISKLLVDSPRRAMAALEEHLCLQKLRTDMTSFDIRRMSPHNDLLFHPSLPPPPLTSSLAHTDTSNSLARAHKLTAAGGSTKTPPMSLHRASPAQLQQRLRLKKYPFFDTLCRLYDRYKPELLPVLLEVTTWHYNSRLNTPVGESRSARTLSVHESHQASSLSSAPLRKFSPFRQLSQQMRSDSSVFAADPQAPKQHSKDSNSQRDEVSGGVFYGLALGALSPLGNLLRDHKTFDARVSARFVLLRCAGHLADATRVLLHYGRFTEARVFALEHSEESSAVRTELFETVLKFWLDSELNLDRDSPVSSAAPNFAGSSTSSSSSAVTRSTSRNTLDLWDRASRRTPSPRSRKRAELKAEDDVLGSVSSAPPGRVRPSSSRSDRARHLTAAPNSFSCSCGMRSLGLIERCACEESLEHVVISLIPAQFSVFAFLQLVARCCREREQSRNSSMGDRSRAPQGSSHSSSITGSSSTERKDSLSYGLTRTNRESLKSRTGTTYDDMGTRSGESPLLSLPVLEVLKGHGGVERDGASRGRRQARDAVGGTGCFSLSQLRNIMTHFIAESTS